MFHISDQNHSFYDSTNLYFLKNPELMNFFTQPSLDIALTSNFLVLLFPQSVKYL